jgi:polygalacturonase
MTIKEIRIHFLLGLLLCPGHLFAAPFNVRNFGARGDKATNDAPAVQAAVDACSQAGGGDVVFPAGDYFCGKITLRSNVTIKLEAGATIYASGKAGDYAAEPGPEGNWYLFVADGQANIAIVGEGQIEGIDKENSVARAGSTDGSLPSHRFGIAHFTDSKFLRFRDVRILYSDWHTLVLSRCEKVFMDGISIINNFFHSDSDGIAPESCKDVFISNCYVIAGGDCICPKTEKGFPLENLVVQNCILESIATGFKLRADSTADFRDIKVSNCVIRNSGVGLGIFIQDGGRAEHVSFENISITTTGPATPISPRLRNNIIPICVDIEKQDNSRIGSIRDLSFSHIQIESDSGILIQGTPGGPIENLVMQDVTVRVNRPCDFAQRSKRSDGRGHPDDDRITKFIRQPTYMALAYVNDFRIDNFRLFVDEAVAKEYDRSAIAVFDSRNGVLNEVERISSNTKARRPVVSVSGCKDVTVRTYPPAFNAK